MTYRIVEVAGPTGTHATLIRYDEDQGQSRPARREPTALEATWSGTSPGSGS